MICACIDTSNDETGSSKIMIFGLTERARAIAALLDPTLYTGLCAEMARDGAQRARKAAAEIGRVNPA